MRSYATRLPIRSPTSSYASRRAWSIGGSSRRCHQRIRATRTRSARLRSMRARLACALLVCGVVGCGPTSVKKKPGTDARGPDGPPPPHELIGIQVNPTNPIIELDLNQPGNQQFTAIGLYADGVNED